MCVFEEKYRRLLKGRSLHFYVQKALVGMSEAAKIIFLVHDRWILLDTTDDLIWILKIEVSFYYYCKKK